MGKSLVINRDILEAALAGLEAQKHKLESQIASVHALLGGKVARVTGSSAGAPVRQKRILSDDARKRIAAAQKKRWAAYHKSRA